MKDCIIKDSWQDSKSENRLVEIIRLELDGYFPFATQSYDINTTWSKPPNTHTLCTPVERNPQPKDTARTEQASLERF